MQNELTVRDPGAVALTPQEVIDNAHTQAKLLMDIVDKAKCFQLIGGKKYLMVEAWETIGAFNRTHAETDTVEPILKDNETIGYRAHVQLFKDGEVVGGAWMPCFFTENCCKGKQGDAKHKACMSAAQTFATSKAYRMNYSYIAILAGYEPTPAEEIDDSPRVIVQNPAPLSDGPEPGPKYPRNPDTVTTVAQLLVACAKDFSLQKADVCKELNLNDIGQLTSKPSEAYMVIAYPRCK